MNRNITKAGKPPCHLYAHKSPHANGTMGSSIPNHPISSNDRSKSPTLSYSSLSLSRSLICSHRSSLYGGQVSRPHAARIHDTKRQHIYRSFSSSSSPQSQDSHAIIGGQTDDALRDSYTELDKGRDRATTADSRHPMHGIGPGNRSIRPIFTRGQGQGKHPPDSYERPITTGDVMFSRTTNLDLQSKLLNLSDHDHLSDDIISHAHAVETQYKIDSEVAADGRKHLHELEMRVITEVFSLYETLMMLSGQIQDGGGDMTISAQSRGAKQIQKVLSQHDIPSLLNIIFHQHQIYQIRQLIALSHLPAIRRQFPSANLVIYGSSATGISGPGADIDISIEGVLPPDLESPRFIDATRLNQTIVNQSNLLHIESIDRLTSNDNTFFSRICQESNLSSDHHDDDSMTSSTITPTASDHSHLPQFSWLGESPVPTQTDTISLEDRYKSLQNSLTSALFSLHVLSENQLQCNSVGIPKIPPPLPQQRTQHPRGDKPPATIGETYSSQLKQYFRDKRRDLIRTTYENLQHNRPEVYPTSLEFLSQKKVILPQQPSLVPSFFSPTTTTTTPAAKATARASSNEAEGVLTTKTSTKIKNKPHDSDYFEQFQECSCGNSLTPMCMCSGGVPMDSMDSTIKRAKVGQHSTMTTISTSNQKISSTADNDDDNGRKMKNIPTTLTEQVHRELSQTQSSKPTPQVISTTKTVFSPLLGLLFPRKSQQTRQEESTSSVSNISSSGDMSAHVETPLEAPAKAPVDAPVEAEQTKNKASIIKAKSIRASLIEIDDNDDHTQSTHHHSDDIDTDLSSDDIDSIFHAHKRADAATHTHTHTHTKRIGISPPIHLYGDHPSFINRASHRKRAQFISTIASMLQRRGTHISEVLTRMATRFPMIRTQVSLTSSNIATYFYFEKSSFLSHVQKAYQHRKTRTVTPPTQSEEVDKVDSTMLHVLKRTSNPSGFFKIPHYQSHINPSYLWFAVRYVAFRTLCIKGIPRNIAQLICDIDDDKIDLIDKYLSIHHPNDFSFPSVQQANETTRSNEMAADLTIDNLSIDKNAVPPSPPPQLTTSKIDMKTVPRYMREFTPYAHLVPQQTDVLSLRLAEQLAYHIDNHFSSVATTSPTTDEIDVIDSDPVSRSPHQQQQQQHSRNPITKAIHEIRTSADRSTTPVYVHNRSTYEEQYEITNARYKASTSSDPRFKESGGSTPVPTHHGTLDPFGNSSSSIDEDASEEKLVQHHEDPVIRPLKDKSNPTSSQQQQQPSESVENHLDDEAFIQRLSSTIHSTSQLLSTFSFTPPDGEIQCDLSLSNHVGILNTALLSEYVKIDPRVAPLSVLVKQWAQNSQLHGARDRGLSSYAFMILTIFYLQQVKVLPVLQKYAAIGNDISHPSDSVINTAPCENDNTGVKQTAASVRWAYHDQMNGFIYNDELIGYGASDYARNFSLLDLYHGFCSFYSTFDFSQFVVSIRHGQPIAREYKDLYHWPSLFKGRTTRSMERRHDGSSSHPATWDVPDDIFISIEDPIDISHDLSRQCDPSYAKQFQLACRETARQLHSIKTVSKSAIPTMVPLIHEYVKHSQQQLVGRDQYNPEIQQNHHSSTNGSADGLAHPSKTEDSNPQSSKIGGASSTDSHGSRNITQADYLLTTVFPLQAPSQQAVGDLVTNVTNGPSRNRQILQDIPNVPTVYEAAVNLQLFGRQEPFSSIIYDHFDAYRTSHTDLASFHDICREMRQGVQQHHRRDTEGKPHQQRERLKREDHPMSSKSDQRDTKWDVAEDSIDGFISALKYFETSGSGHPHQRHRVSAGTDPHPRKYIGSGSSTRRVDFEDLQVHHQEQIQKQQGKKKVKRSIKHEFDLLSADEYISGDPYGKQSHSHPQFDSGQVDANIQAYTAANRNQKKFTQPTQHRSVKNSSIHKNDRFHLSLSQFDFDEPFNKATKLPQKQDAIKRVAMRGSSPGGSSHRDITTDGETEQQELMRLLQTKRRQEPYFRDIFTQSQSQQQQQHKRKPHGEKLAMMSSDLHVDDVFDDQYLSIALKESDLYPDIQSSLNQHDRRRSSHRTSPRRRK